MRGLPRLTVGRVVLGLGVLAVAVIGIVWISALRALDPEPHRAVLDALQIPTSWELAHEEIVQNILFGSRIERYYLVDADPNDVVSPAESMLTRAGFTTTIRRAPTDWCDTRPLRATPAGVCPEKVIPPCLTNGPTGPMTCSFEASRGQECMDVTAYDRGRMATCYTGNGRPPDLGSRSDRGPLD
jgi:hypothetical protein